MMKMIKDSSWVLIRKETIIWAQKNNNVNEIKREIENQINKNRGTKDEDDWKRYLNEVLKILEDR